MTLANKIIEHGPYDAAVHQRYGAQTYSHTGAELNELRDELIELRRKAEAYDRLFEVAAPTPTPYVFVQWKGTELCGDFHCSCGASGHIDDEFAYSVECNACGKVWETPINLPLINGRDEPHVLVQMDREGA